eukprot:666201-Amphidinium_carterae.1
MFHILQVFDPQSRIKCCNNLLTWTWKLEYLKRVDQMWCPPSTHQQGYMQERQQFTHYPSHDQGQGQIFTMAPPEPRPMTHENQGGGQGGGNHVHVANNEVNHQLGQSKPREASSIDLPELPTPPKFKSWRSA